MHNEYDDEIASAREWLGLDDDRPLTFGDYAWMAVQLISVSAFVVSMLFGAGLLIGDI